MTAAREGRIHLVRGDDPALVGQAAHGLIGRLVGERDAAVVVEEHGGTGDIEVGAVVDACTTPPFLVDRRVVVVRDAGRLTAADAGRIVAALDQPVPEVHLVLVAGGGAVPSALAKVAGSEGEILDASAGRGRDRSRWLAEHVRQGPVRLDAEATRRLELHLGEDLGRLAGILETLAAAYGPRATVGAAELEPFLGEAGGVPPWELTDAIDAGDPAGAVRALRRMMAAGGRAAPLVVASLHNHFSAMLRLDGADVVSAEDAAALIGARSAFAAKKALDRARALGSERIAQAVTLIADADLDVKGRTGLAPEIVLEILVARLARLARSSAPQARGSAAGRPSRRR